MSPAFNDINGFFLKMFFQEMIKALISCSFVFIIFGVNMKIGFLQKNDSF